MLDDDHYKMEEGRQWWCVLAAGLGDGVRKWGKGEKREEGGQDSNDVDCEL